MARVAVALSCSADVKPELERLSRSRSRAAPTLKGSRQMWLYAAENVPSRRQADFEALKNADLHTARA